MLSNLRTNTLNLNHSFYVIVIERDPIGRLRDFRQDGNTITRRQMTSTALTFFRGFTGTKLFSFHFTSQKGEDRPQSNGQYDNYTVHTHSNTTRTETN